MTNSILNSIKKVIGISESDTAFDIDILMHINSTFSNLQQLGVGPTNGFLVESASDEWEDFLDENNAMNMIRSYVYLNVRSLFDPPATSFMIDAMNKQIAQYEWRISHQREWELNPVDPMTESEV